MMAIALGPAAGLRAGADLHIRYLSRSGILTSRPSVRDGSAGDGNALPGVVTLRGLPRGVYYLQIDNNRRPGDDDIFYRANVGAQGQLVGRLEPMAPLPITASAGLRKGATIHVFNADQSRRLATHRDDSGIDWDLSGNTKFTTMVPKDTTVVVHIMNPGSRTPIVRAYRNGELVAVPPKAVSASVRNEANRVAALIRKHAGTIALYLSQSALRNSDTIIKENLKGHVASAGIQRSAVMAADALHALQKGRFRASDGTLLSFNDVLRIAGETRTRWSAHKPKVDRFQRLRSDANREVVNAARQLILSLRDQKIQEVIDLIPGRFDDLSNVGVQINVQNIKELMQKYSNVLRDVTKIFSLIRQYSGRSLNSDLAVGDTWQNDLVARIKSLTTATTTAVKSFQDGIIAGLNAQQAAAARQKALAGLNIAMSVFAFAAVGTTLFANVAKHVDKGYIWDAVSAGGSTLALIALSLSTAGSMERQSQQALGGARIQVPAQVAAEVSKMTETFARAELEIAKHSPGLQTKEDFEDRRNPAPGFVYYTDDNRFVYIGYTERQRSIREETGVFYWVERTSYKRWLLG